MSRSWTDISWRDRFALARMAVLALCMRAAVMVLPFRLVHRVVTEGARGTGAPPNEAYMQRNAWAANAVGRRLLGDRPCLPQALVAHWLLGRKGYATELRIGVTKTVSGGLRAHAWVEYKGRVIVGGHLSPYAFRPLEPVARPLPK